jgi:outer membrane protein assembly factor BamB
VKLSDFGGKVPNWGYTESVLVDGEHVVCTPGGPDGAILALNKKTREKIWQSGDFTDGAQYSSIIKAKHNDKTQYIQLTKESVAGIDATNGGVIWKTDWPGRVAVVPTPIFHEGTVYVTAGYGVGSNLFKLGANNQVEPLYDSKSKRVMKNHHGGVVLVDEHIYGYSDGLGWVCQNLKTGELIWKERSALGKGAIGYADGMLYLVSENGGEVVLISASPKGWSEKGRFVLDPQSKQRKPKGKIWTHPVIANGRLYLRDQELVHAYKVKKE